MAIPKRKVAGLSTNSEAKLVKSKPWKLKAPGVPIEMLRAFENFKNPAVSTSHRLRASGFSKSFSLLDFNPGPTTVDWRNSGAVPIPRSQGTCNTCTSFATIAVVESLHFLKHHSRIRLAPGFIHTCLLQRSCVEGVNAEDALDAAAAHGIAYGYAGDYPFLTDACATTVNLYAISRRVWLPGQNEAMAVLANQGPVVGDMWIDPSFMNLKRGAIYQFQETPNKRLHSVAVVGYDRGQGCWIISNSFGTGWADGGFARVAFGAGGLLDERGGWQILI
jgi:hypothetical protein